MMAVSEILTRVFQRGPAPLPHLDYNVTEHCNLTCVGCDHDSPNAPPKMVDLEVFRKDLIAFRSAGRVRELKDTTPLAACRWCLGSTGQEMPNTQTRARPLQRRMDDFVPPRFPRARRQAKRFAARVRRALH